MGISAALAHRRDKTELLEHAEPVIEPPVFHDFAACHAGDFDAKAHENFVILLWWKSSHL